MITEQALEEAIAECKGEKNPNANTCVKLAAYYVLKDKMYPDEKDPIPVVQNRNMSYSYSAPLYESNSDFFNTVKGRTLDEIMPVLDEMMVTLEVLHPRLYNAVMRNLQNS